MIQNYNISIDIYGKCGEKGSPDFDFKTVGEANFFANYRFYLAFENSLCDDYITEKAYHALYTSYISGTIPVVFGGSNYADFNEAVIKIDKNDLGRAVEMMKMLSKSKEKLGKYYEWHRTALFEKGQEFDWESDRYNSEYAKPFAWYNLCEKLWENDNQIAQPIRPKLGQCRSPW